MELRICIFQKAIKPQFVLPTHELTMEVDLFDILESRYVNQRITQILMT